MASRVIVNRRSRRHLTQGQYPPNQAFTGVITSVGASAALVVCPTALVLSGIPQYSLSAGGGVPTAAVLTTPTSVTLTFGTTIAGKTLTVPAGDPAIRSNTGGTVAAQAKTF